MQVLHCEGRRLASENGQSVINADKAPNKVLQNKSSTHNDEIFDEAKQQVKFLLKNKEQIFIKKVILLILKQ